MDMNKIKHNIKKNGSHERRKFRIRNVKISFFVLFRFLFFFFLLSIMYSAIVFEIFYFLKKAIGRWHKHRNSLILGFILGPNLVFTECMFLPSELKIYHFSTRNSMNASFNSLLNIL